MQMARRESIADEEATGGKAITPLFAVRLWKEELGADSEYRGSVREVTSGASRSFHDWSDLVAFMVARIEERPREREVGDGSQ